MILKIDSDTVNIIIPVYNVEKYLPKCIESAINQTYKNLRIILVDDGSTDSCPLICDEYAKTDERICVIHKENSGSASARNVGIDYIYQNGKGGYIYFLDSDDYIENNLIEKCVNTIEKEKCDFVIFNNIMEDEAGEKVYFVLLKPAVYSFKNDRQRFRYISEIIANGLNGAWSSWNRLFRTDFIINNNLKYPYYRIAEDLVFVMEAALYQTKIATIADTLYHYVQHSNSVMNSTKVMPYDKIIELYSYFEEYTIKNGYGALIKKEGPFIFSRLLLYEISKLNGNLAGKIENFIREIDNEKNLKLVQRWFNEASLHKLKLLKKTGVMNALQICIMADELTDKRLRKNKLYIVLQKMWNSFR